MTNIAAVLKAEISRLARREINKETDSLRKTSAYLRHEIAALKRQIAQLERQAKRSAKAAERPTVEPAGEDVNLRFRAAGFAQHRKRLGLSAADMGRLLRVSALTVYRWEGGQVKPRREQLPAIAAIRTLGKRGAAQRLEELAGQ